MRVSHAGSHEFIEESLLQHDVSYAVLAHHAPERRGPHQVLPQVCAGVEVRAQLGEGREGEVVHSAHVSLQLVTR